MEMRTAVYVDGFNLFHRLLDGRQGEKWLDLFALSRAALRRDHSVTMLRYFTARVADTSADPDKASRQDVYLRALAASGVSIHFGTFRQREKRMRLAVPGDARDPYVRVISREEKGSDVNLAVHMLHDAWNDAYDCAVVLSNDSDLAEALRLVRDMGKIVGILCPAKDPVVELEKNAHFVRPVRLAHLTHSQFPDQIIDDVGAVISCPTKWIHADCLDL